MDDRTAETALSLTKFGVGQPVRRTEDPTLVRGQGRYTDDMSRPGQAYAIMVRSREAHGVIRLEQVRIAQGGEGNKLKVPLSTSMYLGDKWEYLFRLGSTPVRAHGPDELAPGEYWLEFPAEKLWVF